MSDPTPEPEHPWPGEVVQPQERADEDVERMRRQIAWLRDDSETYEDPGTCEEVADSLTRVLDDYDRLRTAESPEARDDLPGSARVNAHGRVLATELAEKLCGLREAVATHLRYLDGEVVEGLRSRRHTREVVANIAEHQSRNLRATLLESGSLTPDGYASRTLSLNVEWPAPPAPPEREAAREDEEDPAVFLEHVAAILSEPLTLEDLEPDQWADLSESLLEIARILRAPAPLPEAAREEELVADQWRKGNDNLWRNDRFGGAYKIENAVARIGSRHGEVTQAPAPPPGDEELREAARALLDTIDPDGINWRERERLAAALRNPTPPQSTEILEGRDRQVRGAGSRTDGGTQPIPAADTGPTAEYETGPPSKDLGPATPPQSTDQEAVAPLLTREQIVALTTRPDLLAAEATLVTERQVKWRGRVRELGDYGTRGGSASDRRTIVEAMAALEEAAAG